MNELLNITGSVKRLLFCFFSIILISGCSSIPSKSVEKTRQPGIVSFSSNDFSFKYSFKLNGQTFVTPRGGGV